MRALRRTGDLAVIRRLIVEHGLGHWRGYGIAFALMAVVGWTTAMSAWLMKDIINDVFVSKNESAIWLIAGSIVAIYTLKGMAAYGQQICLSRIANAIVASIQRQLFEKMLVLDVRFFDSQRSSEFIARQSFIASSAASSLNIVVTSLGRDLLTLLGLTAVMALQDPVMSLVSIVVLPGAVFGVRSLMQRARKVMRKEFAGALEIITTVQETAIGIRTVKSFTLENMLRRRMTLAIDGVKQASDKLAMVSSRSGPVMETLGGFAVAGVVVYGGYKVVAGGQSPGAFFSFITALLMAYEPAKRLARVHVDLSSSLIGVQMLFDFDDIPARDAEPADLPELSVSAGEISFERVSFSYRTGELALNNLSLHVPAGQTVALVGPSGGGKSTIISLLQRLFDPLEGQIKIDGTCINDVSRRSVRRQIAVVSQDPFLFSGTVYDNIAVGLPGATREQVLEAARVAYAHDFIMSFQQDYQTQVGEQGHQLSGGQRQRIAIARAVLKNAPILLFDEATSALDNQSEREVQLALKALMSHRTTIVIAHRLQTIQEADCIYVIDRGQVTEHGSHSALIRKDGLYCRLLNPIRSTA